MSHQPSRQPHQSTGLDPSLYQQGQRYGNGGHYQQQVVKQETGDSLNHLSEQLRSVLDFSRLPSLEEALSPSGSPPLPPSPPPLPLFSRCPFTNQVLKLDWSYPFSFKSYSAGSALGFARSSRTCSTAPIASTPEG